MKKLSPKQQAFVEAYCHNGFNATQAAITAGYSAKTARSQGQRLLTKDDIMPSIEAFKEKASQNALVSTQDIVRLLYVEAQGLGEDSTPSARVAALKALTDYTGGFDANTIKQQVSGPNGGAIENKWTVEIVSSEK